MKVWSSSESEHKLNFVCSENQFFVTGTADCVLKMCVLFSCGRSGLLTGNTGLIVQFIVGALCLWPSSPSLARYVGDVGMWVMSSQCQLKVKMQKCKSPPSCSALLGCWAVTLTSCWLSLVMWPEPSVSLVRPSSSRQKLWGRWLSGRRPLLILVQRSLAVREEDGEHGLISTSLLRLQCQVCRSEPTPPYDTSLTHLHIQMSKSSLRQKYIMIRARWSNQLYMTTVGKCSNIIINTERLDKSKINSMKEGRKEGRKNDKYNKAKS